MTTLIPFRTSSTAPPWPTPLKLLGGEGGINFCSVLISYHIWVLSCSKFHFYVPPFRERGAGDWLSSFSDPTFLKDCLLECELVGPHILAQPVHPDRLMIYFSPPYFSFSLLRCRRNLGPHEHIHTNRAPAWATSPGFRIVWSSFKSMAQRNRDGRDPRTRNHELFHISANMSKMQFTYCIHIYALVK